MAIRKLYIAIECADDAQKARLQQILDELSNSRILTADKIISAYPMYKERENDLRQLFSMISNGGVKALMSVQGATILAKLARR